MTDNQEQPQTPHTLCPEDAAVLDALIEARAEGLERGPMPPGSGERAQKVQDLLGLLAMDRAEDAADDAKLDALTAKTLEAVNEQRQRQRFAEQVQVFREPRRTIGVGWRQVMTAAAVFMIGISLLLPVLNKVDADAKRTACATQMQAVGAGFGSYAASHNNRLPRYEPNPQAQWWRVGQDQASNEQAPQRTQSNSANLYLLVRGGFIQPDQLNCPANEYAPASGAMTAKHLDFPNHRAISYSYQNQFRVEPITLDGQAAIAILADRNPLFVITPGRFSQSAAATSAPSVVHGSRGQNVLLSDGRVVWTVRPVFDRADGKGKDNIWTARGVQSYTGAETPADSLDSFLVP